MTDVPVTRDEYELLKARIDTLSKALLDDLEWRLMNDVAIGYGAVHTETLSEVRWAADPEG
jgi:hypothetical protein